MILLRFLGYTIALAVLCLILINIEIASPGALSLHVQTPLAPTHGTSEFSPVEWLQLIFLLTSFIVSAGVARVSWQQRPLAIMLAAVSLAGVIRELDFYLDVYLLDHLWQVLLVILVALTYVYQWRHLKALQLAWYRAWPSPGLCFVLIGGMLVLAFAPIVSHEPFWLALAGEHYQRVVKLAVEELFELFGYYLWLIGTLEYAMEVYARVHIAIAERVAERRKRQRRDKA